MKKLLSTFLLIVIVLIGYTQTYNMSNTPITTCSGTYYDSQGTSNYLDNENYTQTFTSSGGVGSKIVFNFTAFRTQLTSDYLKIYDGPSTASPLIGTYSGNLGAGIGTITSSGTSLTFQFISNADGNTRAGWIATISCIVPFPDECSTATSIAVGNSCSYSTYTLTGATNSTTTPLPTCANYSTACEDVWFKVTVPSCGRLIFDTQTGGITDGGMAIYSGTCGALTLIECDDDDSPNGMMPMIDRTGLTPGSTVYIRVWEYGGDVVGTFGLCVYNPNPDCFGTPSPGVTSYSPSGTLCISDAFTLSTEQTYFCGLTYQWQSSSNNITYSNISGATSSTYSSTASTSIWYRLVVTCTNSGLSANSTPIQVIVNTTINNCSNAHVISNLPFNATGMTTCCMGNDYVSGDACTSTYLEGDDYTFVYTPSTDVVIDISLLNTLSYTGVFVTQKCPDAGGASCIAYNESSTGNPQLCGVSLNGGTTYYVTVDTDPLPDCTPFDILITESTSPNCNLNYSISSITYSWENMFGGTNITIPTDDDFASSWTTLGFTFCYDGIGYSQALLSSNGYIIFPPVNCVTNLPTTNAVPDGYSGYSIDYIVPNTNQAPRNCIMFPWMDTDPNNGGTMTFKVFGTAPNRYAVFEYDAVKLFSSSCPNRYMTAQVKLFETSNNIEIHIDQKDTCEYWNEGAAVLGLHNYNGTIAVIPPGHNYGDVWVANNQAWKFTCNCPDCVILPIELKSFDYECSDDLITFKWTTLTETNNDYFTLEESSDAVNFRKIAIIEGAENSNNPIAYTYEHFQNKDYYYYRLKQTDFDGASETFETIYVNCNKDSEVVKLYPNPAFNGDDINIKGKYEEIIIENILGIECFPIITNGKIIGLEPGAYIVTVDKKHRIKLTVR